MVRLLILLSSCAWAETWADEATPAPQELPSPPPVGVTAGVQIGSGASNLGPIVGTRVGIRLRLSRHTALSLMTMYEFQSFSGRTLDEVTTEHLVSGVVRLELFSVSAFERLLVPEFSIGFFLGAGAAFEGSQTAATFLGGLHLGMTRLRPSGWWFPIFVEVGLQSWGLGPGWRFAVGVGL